MTDTAEIHLLKSSDRTAKKILAKCGFEVRFPKDSKLPADFSGWFSEVTCQECRGL